ncbi:MAG: uroporphyrinogen decarboxylase family protein [bacterium]
MFREALRATLNFERSDGVCHFEWGYWPETLRRWREEGMPEGVAPWEAVGITFYHRVPVKVRFCPEFEDKVIEDRGDYIIRQNENGIILREFKDRTSMPEFIEYPVKNLRDFEALKERLDPRTPERFPEDWEDIARSLNARDSILVLGQVEISFFGWHRDLMGVERLLVSFYDQPELIHAISRHHVHFLKELYSKVMRDVEFDFVFMWEDMAFKNGPLISPEFVREFMLPYYREITGFFKESGGYKILLDSDGDIAKLIPLFREGGVDGLLPFECAAGMDIRRVREEYPDLIIAGGIDKREIAKGREAIDRELESKLPFMFRRGGYLPSMDHHVPPEVSFEDFMYYVERVKELYLQNR